MALTKSTFINEVFNGGFAPEFSVSVLKEIIALVQDYVSETSTMVFFKIETLNSGANPPLYISFIKLDVAIATFKNLLKISVLKERLNKTDMEKVG